MASWKKVYFGSVLPTSDGFSATSGDTVDATIVNVRAMGDGASWLEWDDDAGATNARFEATNSTSAKWDPTNATGWTLYLIIQVVANQKTIVIDDGGYRETLTLQIGTVNLGGQTSSQDLQRPRAIRITGVGTAWKAYIDESDTVIATLTASGATSAELLRFGTVTANAKVLLYMLAWTDDGAYAPTQLAAPDVTTTYVTPSEVRDFVGVLADSVGDGVAASLIRKNEKLVDDIFAGPNPRRTKLIFGAGGTETNENIDYRRADDGEYARTLYPYITTLTSLTYYSGSAYQAMTSGRTSNYYASAEDLEAGRIRIRINIPYKQDSLQATYTWGISAANEFKRREAAKLCLYLSAVDVMNAALQHGAADVFAQRKTWLKEEVDRMTKEFAGRKSKDWMVL